VKEVNDIAEKILWHESKPNTVSVMATPVSMLTREIITSAAGLRHTLNKMVTLGTGNSRMAESKEKHNNCRQENTMYLRSRICIFVLYVHYD
jgi:hypothetical protein